MNKLFNLIFQALSIGGRYPSLLGMAVAWSYFTALVLKQDTSLTVLNFAFGDSGLRAPHQNLSVSHLLALLLGLIFTAGYYYVWRRAIEDNAVPTAESFISGIRMFFGRLLGWNLLIAAVVLVAGLVGVILFRGGPLLVFGILSIGVLIIAAIVYSLVDAIIVVQDRDLSDAISTSPAMVGRNFWTLVGLVIAGILAALVLSLPLLLFGPAAGLFAPLVSGLMNAWSAGAIIGLVLEDHEW